MPEAVHADEAVDVVAGVHRGRVAEVLDDLERVSDRLCLQAVAGVVDRANDIGDLRARRVHDDAGKAVTGGRVVIDGRLGGEGDPALAQRALERAQRGVGLACVEHAQAQDQLLIVWCAVQREAG